MSSLWSMCSSPYVVRLHTQGQVLSMWGSSRLSYKKSMRDTQKRVWISTTIVLLTLCKNGWKDRLSVQMKRGLVASETLLCGWHLPMMYFEIRSREAKCLPLLWAADQCAFSCQPSIAKCVLAFSSANLSNYIQRDVSWYKWKGETDTLENSNMHVT